MVRILEPTGNGAYLISTLKGEVDVNGVASEFLAISFSSQVLSSFISSFIRKTIRRSSLLLEVAELCLASR